MTGTPIAARSALPADIEWRWRRFDDLDVRELQNIYAARQLAFAIEQQCIYLDADEADEVSYHLAAWSPEHAMPLAYARLVNPGVKYEEPSMGRVITTLPARGLGLGRELVRRVIEHNAIVHPGWGIRISAQTRLAHFYGEFGFDSVGEPYIEDGIPHLEMLRRA